MAHSLQCHLRLAWGEHAADFELRVPARPLRLAEVAAAAAALTDAVVSAAVAREVEQGRALSCQAGCGACCRQLVGVSAPEAFRLADHIVGLDARDRDGWIERFEQAERALRGSALGPRLVALMERGPVGADLSTLARDYFALGLPCPLLVEESCALHPVRPLSCRDFNVTTPPDWCADPTSHPVHKIATPPLLAVPLARLTAKLTRGKTALIPLGLALGWVEAHARLGVATWPGDRLLGELVKEIRRSG